MGGNLIICGDALTELKKLDSESVDAVVTDPPYGTASPSKVTKRGDKLVTFEISWDSELSFKWLPEVERILKPGGSLIFFVDNKAITTAWVAVEQINLRPLQNFCWVKSNPIPNPRKNFMSGFELALFSRKPGVVLYWGGEGSTPNYFLAGLCQGIERTKHPTQKPLSLFRHLVRCVCPPGGTVLDPFMGSGTTGEAAIGLGRKFIGIDINAEYVAMAKRRLSEIQAVMF
jgi:DNA modification methylase